KTKAPYDVADVTGFLDSQSLQLNRVIIGNTNARKSAGVDALPTTLLVDKQGRVDRKLVGFTPENTAEISSWLKKRKK
ncbi:MAG: TlpA family protein disulfide reductase, partial [Parvibaculales bacterium]